MCQWSEKADWKNGKTSHCRSLLFKHSILMCRYLTKCENSRDLAQLVCAIPKLLYTHTHTKVYIVTHGAGNERFHDKITTISSVFTQFEDADVGWPLIGQRGKQTAIGVLVERTSRYHDAQNLPTDDDQLVSLGTALLLSLTAAAWPRDAVSQRCHS